MSTTTPNPYEPALSPRDADLVLAIAVLMALSADLPWDHRFREVRILSHAIKYLSDQLDESLTARKMAARTMFQAVEAAKEICS